MAINYGCMGYEKDLEKLLTKNRENMIQNRGSWRALTNRGG